MHELTHKNSKEISCFITYGAYVIDDINDNI